MVEMLSCWLPSVTMPLLELVLLESLQQRRERQSDICIRTLASGGGVPLQSHRKLWKAVAVPPQTLIGRLPLEQGSDHRETLPKRVSDDSQRFGFRRLKKL